MRLLHSCLWLSLLVVSCSDIHFLEDPSYRHQVKADYDARMAETGGVLDPFAGQELTLPEQEALAFLYAYMPLADAVDYPAGFYLENVRASFRAREEMGWKVPEREFRHFVLPLRVNNEKLDSARKVFYRELKPRVQGLSMADAILEVNHWCHEKVTYQPSDARTMSPLSLVRNTLGRCGEESTFCVAALRSVGIPARQVYTPRWAHTDDNHAWVEAWADGAWHFLGACEPEPVLDLGWFNAPASRAMLMHTKVFGRYDGPEEVVLESPNYTEVNLIDNYARTARVDFRVLRADGSPAAGARVDCCIYNYAEFYPAVTKYADEKGRSFLSSGLGDLLIWASQDGAFGFERVRFGGDSCVTIFLNNQMDARQMMIVPPPETAVLPEVTPELRAANDARTAREDSLRHAYEATFRVADPLLARARGNWPVIEAFLKEHEGVERAQQVLAALSTKDLQDITPELLEDYFAAPAPFLGARVENEFLSPFYGFFRTALSAQEKEQLADPAALMAWVQENIAVQSDPTAWRIPITPAGVWKLRQADPRSRDIFFVSMARALGIEAQKDPVTGKVQYRQIDQWLDVRWDGATAPAAAPQGVLCLDYTPGRQVPNPKYYTHFTLSKLVEGRPSLLSFDEGEVDMGGGVDWEHVFRKGSPLDEGEYLLVSGNRLSDGSVPVSMVFFTIKEGEITRVPLQILEGREGLPVLGSFNAELKFIPAGQREEVSVLSQVGRGYFALALVEPGKEPTNHALRDLAAEAASLEAWGRPLVLLCRTEEELTRLQKELSEGRYGALPATAILGIANKALCSALFTTCQASAETLPQVIFADSFNRVYFQSAGYTIGLGAQLSYCFSASSTALK